MQTIDADELSPAEAKVQLQEAFERLAKGIPFSAEERAAAAARMDRRREKNRILFGEQNIAVQLIREARDNA